MLMFMLMLDGVVFVFMLTVFTITRVHGYNQSGSRRMVFVDGCIREVKRQEKQEKHAMTAECRKRAKKKKKKKGK